MRTIEPRFKRAYGRELKGRHGATLVDDVATVLTALASDTPLEARLQDHPLGGDWGSTETATCDRTWC